MAGNSFNTFPWQKSWAFWFKSNWILLFVDQIDNKSVFKQMSNELDVPLSKPNPSKKFCRIQWIKFILNYCLLRSLFIYEFKEIFAWLWKYCLLIMKLFVWLLHSKSIHITRATPLHLFSFHHETNSFGLYSCGSHDGTRHPIYCSVWCVSILIPRNISSKLNCHLS